MEKAMLVDEKLKLVDDCLQIGPEASKCEPEKLNFMPGGLLHTAEDFYSELESDF